MTLEDARIIAGYYRSERLLDYGDRLLAISQMLMAFDILERHLPVPLYHSIDHYLWLGAMDAKGTKFIPYP
jgi:hypothetical protein